MSVPWTSSLLSWGWDASSCEHLTINDQFRYFSAHLVIISAQQQLGSTDMLPGTIY